MTKAVREARDLAQQMGLKLIEVEQGAKHFHLILENSGGVRIRHPISYCAGSSNFSDTRNMRSHFKRFANGLTHGLKVIQ